MKVVNTSGRRKQAVARASLRPGSGIVKINTIPLDLYNPKYLRLKISEALLLAGEKAKKFDIFVRVEGGGIVGQAEAIRLAVARALIEAINDEKIRKAYTDYDRQLLVADIRRKEVSKPNNLGKARSRRQKSYR